jgi:hypothetical protein
LPWPEVRPVLELLSAELDAAGAEGTLPPELTPGQVWLQGEGRVQLMDSAWHGPDTADRTVTPRPPEQRSLALLREVAVLSLEGKPLSAKGVSNPPTPGRAAEGGLSGAWGVALLDFLVGTLLLLLLAMGLLLVAPTLVVMAVTARRNPSLTTADIVLLTVFLGGLVVTGLLYALLRWMAHRSRRYTVRAPVPVHAARMLGRLLGVREPYTTVGQLRADLAATRGHPVEVNMPLWASHLGLLAVCLLPGLLAMLIGSKTLNGFVLSALNDEIVAGEKALKVFEQPGGVRAFVFARMKPGEHRAVEVSWPFGEAKLLDRDEVVEYLGRDKVRGRIRWLLDHDYPILRSRVASCNWVERVCFSEELAEARLTLGREQPSDISDFPLEDLLEVENTARTRLLQGLVVHTGWVIIDRPIATLDLYGVVAVWFGSLAVLLAPTVWVVWAFLWRGGVTHRFMGMALVDGSGAPALRTHCLVRALLTWAPVAGLCGLSLWLDLSQPGMAGTVWACWWLAVAVVAGYFVLALWFPGRSLHDRLSGVYLVPR